MTEVRHFKNAYTKRMYKQSKMPYHEATQLVLIRRVLPQGIASRINGCVSRLRRAKPIYESDFVFRLAARRLGIF